MNPINLFSTATKSRAQAVSAQKRQNCYLEQSDDINAVVAYCMPGLDSFANLGANPVRGIYFLNDYIYAVSGDRLYKVDLSGNYTVYDLILSTNVGIVSFSDNGLQMIIVDGVAGYILTISTNVFENITSSDFVDCNTVCFVSGHFVVEKVNTGQFYISSSYDGFTWNALDYATAESTPDGLIRVYANHGQLYLLGAFSVETWVYSGALDFPLSRLNESTIEAGIAAKWSLSRIDNGFIFLSQTRSGSVQVLQMSGGSPTKVSTNDIDNIINKYLVLDDAIGTSYTFNGHNFYYLSFPAAGESWLYDTTTGYWSRLKSFNLDRSRVNIACSTARNNYLTDFRDGRIYKVNEDTHTEAGDLIEMEVITPHIATQGEIVKVDEIQVNMEHGTGLSTGDYVTPKLMLRASHDDGHTWGNESYLDIGVIGNYAARARRLRLGISRKWSFSVKITAPIKRVITGIFLRTQ